MKKPTWLLTHRYYISWCNGPALTPHRVRPQKVVQPRHRAWQGVGTGHICLTVGPVQRYSHHAALFSAQLEIKLIFFITKKLTHVLLPS